MLDIFNSIDYDSTLARARPWWIIAQPCEEQYDDGVEETSKAVFAPTTRDQRVVRLRLAWSARVYDVVLASRTRQRSQVNDNPSPRRRRRRYRKLRLTKSRGALGVCDVVGARARATFRGINGWGSEKGMKAHGRRRDFHDGREITIASFRLFVCSRRLFFFSFSFSYADDDTEPVTFTAERVQLYCGTHTCARHSRRSLETEEVNKDTHARRRSRSGLDPNARVTTPQ